MDRIKSNDESTIDVCSQDNYTGEGLDNVIISIYNKTCNDSSHICLEFEEIKRLIEILKEHIVDFE